MAEAIDALSVHMVNYEKDQSYRTVELLGAHTARRTERVLSAEGRQCIRKYLPIDAVNPQLFRELAGIRNPHLAQVLDCYELGDRFVVVTEYVEGISLEALLRNVGPLAPAQAERIMADVTDALRSLHDAPSGPIVHRDVKPSNIIVSGQGAVLIDFDISRKWNESADFDTRIWGTSGYAAPEQFGFRQTDARSDVYALGVVLRFMLTGREPQEKVSLRDRGKLVDLIDAAMSLDPANRPQTVGDFQRELSRAVSHVDKKPRGVVVLPREPERPPGQLTLRHVIWRVWQIGMTACCGLLLVCLLAIIAGLAPLSADATVTRDAYAPILVFCVVIPWLLCCDGFRVLEQFAWFREDRLLKVLGMTFASVIVGFVLMYAVQCVHVSLGF